MNEVKENQQDKDVEPRKKYARVWRVLMWMFAVLFALILIVQGAIFGAIWWVNSQSGQDWLKAQVDTVLEGSGYSATFSGLQYRFMTSVSVKDLEIKNAGKPFISADYIDLGLHAFPLAARILSLHADAGTVTIHKLDTVKKDTPLYTPVIVPAIEFPQSYFIKIILDDFSVGRLVLEDQARELSPVLSGDINLLPESKVKTNLTFDVGKDYPKIILKTLYDAPLSKASIRDLSVFQDDMKAVISGEMNFTEEGKGKLRIVPSLPQVKDGLLELEFANAENALEGMARVSGKVDGEFMQSVLPMRVGGNDIQVKGFTASGHGLDLGGDLSITPKDMTLDAVLHKIEGVGVSLNGLTAKIQKREGDVLAATVKTQGMLHQPFELDISSLIDTAAQKIYDVDADIKLGKGTLNLNGVADMNALDLTLEAQAFPLETVVSALPANVAAMTMNTKTHLGGTPAAPVFKSTTQFSPLQVTKNAPKINLVLDAAYQNGKADITVKGEGKGIKAMGGSASVPFTLSLSPFVTDLSEKTPVSGSLAVDADVASLASVILPPDQSFKGNAKLDGKLSGTVFAPDVTGKVKLSQGVYQNKSSGVNLRGIEMSAGVTREAVRLESLKASDGEKGTLNASGTYSLAGGVMDFVFKANDMHMLKGDTADGIFDADVTLKGQSGAYKIGGVLAPKEMKINIPETYSTSIPELNVVKFGKAKAAKAPMGDMIDIDMKVDAPNKIFVRGWGLDAEFGGMLDISGKLDAPLFDGTLKSLRGRYSEFGKNFEIIRANMKFSGTIPPNPVMDILAQTKAESIMAQIAITGALTKPAFTFSAIPALPQDEVLAHILFGKNMDKISPMQAAQLAQTIRRFSGKGGGGGLDPLALVRGVTGLDDIRVDTDGAGSASVGAGKYITEKVYLEFESGAQQGSGGATLEIEVTPSVNIKSKVGQDSQGGAGVFWEHDY